MADRTIVTRMRVEYKQAVDGMNAVGTAAGRASDKIEEAGRQSQRSSQQAQGAFSKMAQHAAANEQAWTTAGSALSVFGGAVVGLGLSAGKAGIEFNSLKQTSGAALKSVMGSAEAARAQMDKLNDFGRTSWVMRDALIRAQQNLTGFGVEAERVIPFLDGLQEAVAAAGGNSQDFEELANVMAKVKSQGKLTAETFNEFGTRGVDAATIIGEQMGKTGQEIRDSVTNGSLDADQALDALAEGMKTKFNGATENLRNTFRGAMDNLSAAWRDLSASMAEPIVGPDGGGLAVAGLNTLADAINDVRDKADAMPNGVKGAVLALGGISGAASLAAGGFLLLMPRIVETKKAFDTLSGAGGVVGATTKAVGGLGKALGIAAGAWLAFESANILANKATEASIPGVEKINSELREMAKNGGNLEGAFGGGNAFTDWMGHSQAVNDMGDALEVIGRHAEAGTTGIAKFREAVTPGRQELEKATAGVEAYDQGLADLVSGGNLDQAQGAFANIAELIPDSMPQDEVMTQFSAYREALQGVANDLDVTGLTEKDYYEWMRGNVPPAIQEATEAQKKAADGYTGMSEAAQQAQEHLEEVRKGLVDSASGFVDFTEKTKDSKTTLEEWITDLEDQVDAQANWLENLGRLAEKGAPQELLDQLAAMGPEGARMVKKLADGSEEDMERVRDAFAKSGRDINSFADLAAGIPDIDLDADASKLKKQIGASKDRLKELEEMPTTPAISAQITLLKEKIEEAEAKLDEVEKGKTTAKVDADTQPAKDEVSGFKKWFKDNSSVTMSVWANIKEKFSSGKKTKQDEHNPNRLHNYHGGILEYYAQGGFKPMDPVAQMVQPNTWRVVGDRADVDEAYIPLDGSNRSRSILMEAIDRMPNLTAMASGGIVGRAERRLADAQKRLDAISNAGQKKTAEDRRRDRAQAQVDRARDALTAAKEAEAKRERITSLRSDLRQDVRRGSIRDQVTGSLSGGYSAVDRLFNLGSNEDLSRASRSKANSSARKFEANLRSLYAQAERIDEKLKKAQDKAQELKGIKDSVTSSLLGGRGVDVGDYQNFENGQWSTYSGVSGATRRMMADVGAMKAFAGKLKKLAAKGVPGAIIQEIAQAGAAEGSTMADAFLDASDAEVKSYVGAWKDYEKYAGQAGQYVTEGFYKGGSQAADGVVKGLEGKQKSVESAIANLAKTMENTFKSVLGIHSPSRVMSELGEFTAEGLALGMLGGVADVRSAADALAGAAVPHAMAFEVSASPVVSDDEGMAELAMQDMSASTLEAMQLMQLAVSEGWANMLLNTQDASAGMLAGTQAGQLGMLNNVQTQQEAMRAAIAQKQLDSRNTVMLEQENMRATVSQKQADSRTKLTAEQENMRATVSQKQSDTRAKLTQEQESMRSIMADKQTQMRVKNAAEFESMRSTTGSKLSSMRGSADNTMSAFSSDYSGHLSRLKSMNRSGFESMLDASNRNMRGIRDGMDGQMKAARPELGGNLNRLIDVLTSFTSSVNKAFGDVGVKLDAPKKVSFATGGVLPGYTPGRDVHEFYSPTAGYLNLSGGEAIMRPEFVRAVGGRQGIDELNKQASGGHLQRETDHFATGGVIPSFSFAKGGTLIDAANWWVRKGARGSRHPAFGGAVRSGHSRNSLHYQDRAVDLNYGPGGTNAIEQAFFDKWVKQFKASFPGIRTIWRAPGHYNHLHIDTGNGADIGNFAGALAAGEMSHPFLDRAKVSSSGNLTKAYERAAKKLTSQIYAKHAKDLPDGIAGQLGRGIMSNASEGLISKAKEYGKTTAVSGSTAGDPAVKAAVRKVAEQMGWDKYWGDIDWLVNKESSWNPKAANPSSSARGLFQKMTSLHGPVEDTVEGQARWGLNYIKSTYGNPAAARRHHERSNWYEQGSANAKSGWAVVGEKGPELIQLAGGERVQNASDTRKLLAKNRTFIPNAGSSGGLDYDALAKAVVSNLPPSLVVNNDNAGLIEERIAKKTVQEFADKQALYTMGV